MMNPLNNENKINSETQAVAWLVFVTLFLLFVLIVFCDPVRAEEVDTDQWANAIFKAEGG